MTRTKTLHNALHAKGKTLFATCILALLATFALQAQTVRYVKETAAGTGDGTSWADASADLQAMINASAVDDEVRVAAGTYKPTKDPFGNASPGNARDKTFYVKDGVKIYGGFSASTPETTLAARSITANVTKLSGDFNGDDVVSGSGSSLSITGNTENAYHVVLASGNTGVTIDGFTIKGGNANNNSFINVNGNTINHRRGGGIYTSSGTNTISNNTISENSANSAGGGVYMNSATNTISNNTISENSSSNDGAGVYTDSATNTISNNTFSGNAAVGNGGGIFTFSGTNTISNNTFSGNKATIYGGGIYTSSGTNTLSNNTLSGNAATNRGGGIFTFSGTNTLSNNTLSGNAASYGGGGIYTYEGTNTLSNNIFWGNKQGAANNVAGADYYAASTNGNTFNNNLLQLASGSYPLSDVLNYGIGTGATGNLFNQDPLFVDAAANNFQLSGCSPAINAGLNTLIVSGVERIPALDILGNGIYNTTKDMGAYERQTAAICCPSGTTLHVNVSVSGGTGDGTSWANAYANLGDALAKAHTCTNIKSIKVATGTYKPTKKPFEAGVEITTIDARDVVFHIPDGVTIEGGYNATTSSRDITANVTTLSGDIGVADVTTDNAFHVIIASAASNSGGVTIDGFTITGGNANVNHTITVNGSTFYRNYGGGIYTSSGTNTLSNNTISGNSVTNSGGIYTYQGINTLSNNTISGNSAIFGGGIYTRNGTNTLSNNTLSGNSASNGGGIYTYQGTNTLSNNTISGNSATSRGGGIYTSSGTNTLSNNIFWGNKQGAANNVAGADYYAASTNGNTFNNNLLQLASSSYPLSDVLNYGIGTGATGNLFAQDPLFVDAAANNFQLSGCSPAINAGLNTLIVSGVERIPTLDILGNGIYNTTKDMGAYERQTAAICCPSGTTLHVNATVSGGTGDGTSWANAYANLGDALAKAHTCTNIKSIKVATGTYKPTKKPFEAGVEITTIDARDVVFHIPDGVTIEGGYNAATGSKDITANVTTLSGDFNNDDVVTGSGSTLSITNNGENAYHVVLSAAPSTGGIGITVDGFTIKGGNASTDGSFTLNGYTVYRSNAGGIYTHYGTNTLSNNTLSGNSAIYNGGAIYINFGINTLNNNTIFANKIDENGGGIGINEGANTLTNNTLSGNKANNNGGGIYTDKGINTLTNNTFSGNVATYNGGGVYTNNGTNTLTNNTLSGNSAGNEGGGVYTNQGTNNTLNNNTFSENIAYNGGGIYTYGGANTFINNIFWGNKIGTDATVQSADYYANGTNGNTFTNNLLQLVASNYPVSNSGPYAIGTTASGNVFAQNPSFVYATDLDGADNIHRTADDGLQLDGCSVAIDAGITPPLGVGGLDILGNAIYNSLKDMGAYERQSAKFSPATAAIAVTNNCTNSTLNLTTNGTSFLWSNGATTEDITISAAGLYTVTVSGSNVCTATASGTAALEAIPTAAIAVTNNCTNSTLNLTTNGTSFLWSNGATTEDITVSAAGLYTVTVSGSNVCTTSVSGTAAPNARGIIYVSTSASTGNNDGTSWANAYRGSDALQNALDVAICTDDQVWVAAGTYKPTKDPFGNASPGDTRDKTFYVKDGVKIYGGFSASAPEATLAARSITTNVTTLSGDFNNDDAVTGSGSTLSITNNGENAYHVVLSAAPSTGGIGITVDGFTIKGGNASTNGSFTLNGYTVYRSNAGGIYTHYGTNTLSNNTLSGNSAIYNGGAIYINFGTNTLSNNTIFANKIDENGGGIGINEGANTLTNNIISGNRAIYYAGAGIYINKGINTLTNNTFSDNAANNNGGGIFTNNGTNTLTNNIFWNNKVGTDATVASADYHADGTNGNTFTNNLLQLAASNYAVSNTGNYAIGTAASGNIFAQNPNFIDATDLDGADNIHRTADDGLQILCGSPAINTGITPPLGVGGLDILGNAIFASIKDMGAYESQIALPTAYNVTGGGNYCYATPSNIAVGLANSEAGVTYQLKNGTSDVGTTEPATGTSINFGFKTAGTYTVVATRTSDGCIATMTGSAFVTSNICCPSGTTLHVNVSVSGGTGDGSSWANAYANLSEALAKIYTCSNITTVKVATGTYKPTKQPFQGGVEMSTGDDRDRTFHIPDGVAIEGGYNAATGSKDITANVTTLSGDFNNDDVVSGSGSTLAITDNSENAYHVVLSAAPSTGGIGITVDGFTIKGGNASTNGSFTLNGYTVYRSNAGGIYTHYGTNTLSNNTLSGNSAIYNGGAIYINFGTNTLSNNTIFANQIRDNGGGIAINEGTNTLTNNTLSGNKAYKGGGIYTNVGINTLTNNTLSDNLATIDGGGVYTAYGTNAFTNNIFWGNKKDNDATAFRADYYADGTNGNTFTNNLLQLAASNYAVSNTGNSAIGAAASGNIFAQNPSFVDASDLDGADNIHRTADDGLQILCGSPAINTGITPPLGVGGLDILGNAIFNSIKDMGAYENQTVLPTAYNTTGGGNYCYGTVSNIAVGLANSESGMTYKLKNGTTDIGSPITGTGAAIDFANQTAGTYTVVATRTSDGCIATMTGSAIVTSNVCCLSGTTLHVNASVSGGTGDGLSWANAYASLSDALFVAHSCNAIKTIKVATGTYKPTKKPVEGNLEITTSDDRDHTFHIPDGVTIEGGYNAAMGSRDITANVTTLSGDFNNDDVVSGSGSTLAITDNGENAYHVVLSAVPSTGGIGITVDGFTIKGGNADNFNLTNITLNGYLVFQRFGGGIYTNYGTNTLTNNTLSENSAIYGGGIFTNLGTNTLTNNTFLHNLGSIEGGGIYLNLNNSTLTNNTFLGNLAYNGGGIATYEGFNTINNNTLSENSADDGGGIYTNEGINTLTNNTLSGNIASSYGGGILTYLSTNTLTNNTLSGNIASSYGGGILTYLSTNTLTNNTLSGNSANLGGGVYTYGGTNALTNNIFWDNKKETDATVQSADYYADDVNGNTLKNNLLQLASSNYTTTGIGNYDLGVAASGNTFAQDPLFVNAADIDGADNTHRTADDGLRLDGCSVAIDAGITPPLGVGGLDILSNAIYNSIKDMGAYEQQSPQSTLPIIFTLTGGGNYCYGTVSTIAVGLSSSAIGTNYQLKKGLTDIGAVMNGTGAAIDFGNQNAGTYTIVATHATSGCTMAMAGSTVVTSNACCPSGTILHVNASVSGGTGDGTSWANAYASLSEALFMAHNCASFKTIKVATGTYKPTKKPFENGVEMILSDNRYNTFHIPDGVTIEGGYDAATDLRSGGGSILSGDFNNDDIITGSGNTLAITGNEENVFHVVLASANSSTGIGVTIDGFTITGGNATYNPSLSFSLNGNQSEDDLGGGIYTLSGTNTLSNNTFWGNYAATGGGIFTQEGTNTLSNNTFSRNLTDGETDGAGIGTSDGTNTISNNVFAGNKANEGAGGLVTLFGTNTINNNTFYNNSSSYYAGGFFALSSTNTLTNNIFWDNTLDTDAMIQGADYRGLDATNTCKNNLLQLAGSNYTTTGSGDYDLGTAASGNIFAQNPNFIDATDLDGADNIHRTEDDGLSLQNNSPAINAGISGVGIPTADITGGNHVGLPDMGAYEVLCSRLTVNAGTDIVLSCASPTTLLMATSNFSGVSYTWNNGATQGGSVSPSTTTTYTVTATATNGCTATDNVLVTANSVVCLSAVLSGTQTACANASVNLKAIVTNGTAPFTVVITNGTAPDITVNNYVSGEDIAVSNSVTKTYTLVSIKDATNATGSVSGSATVSVDNTAPSITLAASITVSESTLSLLPTTVATTDASAVIVTYTDVKVAVTPPNCYTYRYNIIRTWKATDVCNQSSTKTQSFVSMGIQLTCPADKILNTNSDGTANYDCSSIVKASDNVSPLFLDNCNVSILKYTLSGATAGTGNGSVAGIVLNSGVTTVTYSLQTSIVDKCSFNITIKDVEAPKFGTIGNTIVDACNIPNPITMTTPSVSDNCSGSGGITLTPLMDVTATVNGCASKSAAIKYIKSVTRTWVALDNAGNVSTAVQRMYIRDKQAPTAICKDIIVNIGSSNISVLASQINNGSSDNCTVTSALSLAICRNIGGVCNFASGISLTPSLIPTGSNFVNLPVTLRVTDACGNTSNCTATIRLQKVGSLTNGNNTTDLSTTSDSKAEMEATPTTTSTIDATHGSLKCFPNPFSDNLNLEYNLAKAVSKVTLKVYDNQGRLVTLSEQGEQLEGYYQINWNLSDLQAGMYHICLEIEGKCVKMERVIMLR